jgi:hypothetical protein
MAAFVGTPARQAMRQAVYAILQIAYLVANKTSTLTVAGASLWGGQIRDGGAGKVGTPL